MIFQFDDVKINVEFPNGTDVQGKVLILFIHGFTGSSDDWNSISKELPENFVSICIDLIGHGKSDKPTNKTFYSIDYQIKIIEDLLVQLKVEELIICGYSMGGRIALNFAVKNPQKIKALIIENTNPGIEDDSERSKRRKSDEQISGFILNKSIEQFIDYWLSLHIFTSLVDLPAPKYSELRSRKLNNSKTGLANTITEMSPGKIQSIWESLDKFDFPILLVGGEKDKKYVEILKKMNSILHDSKMEIIEKAGHNVHFERSDEFKEKLSKFLRTL